MSESVPRGNRPATPGQRIYDAGFEDGRVVNAEVMKRAIINVICGWQDEEHCGRDARAIAAEYDRLILDEVGVAGLTEEPHGITDPMAPLGYQCGDAACEWHGVERNRADSPSPEGAIIITPDHEGDARRIAASLADMIGSASGSPEGAEPRGYVNGMYHLTGPEYNAALRRAYKDGREAALPEPHPDAGRLDRNHYDRFTAGEAEDVLRNLDACREKYEESLTDPFVHDHAKVALTLIDEIQRLAALPEPSLDVERLARALAAVGPGLFTYPTSGSADEGVPYKLNALHEAGQIAAEYARLRGTGGSPESA